MTRDLEIKEFSNKEEYSGPCSIIVSSYEDFQGNLPGILKWADEGANVIFLLDKMERKVIDIGIAGLDIKEMNGLTFLCRNREESVTKAFRPKDFSFWYNKDEDCIGIIADKYIESGLLTPVLFTYEKPAFSECMQWRKRKLPVAGYMEHGKGKIIFLTLKLAGFAGVNPVLDRFLSNILLMH